MKTCSIIKLIVRCRCCIKNDSITYEVPGVGTVRLMKWQWLLWSACLVPCSFFSSSNGFPIKDLTVFHEVSLALRASRLNFSVLADRWNCILCCQLAVIRQHSGPQVLDGHGWASSRKHPLENVVLRATPSQFCPSKKDFMFQERAWVGWLRAPAMVYGHHTESVIQLIWVIQRSLEVQRHLQNFFLDQWSGPP